MIDRFADDLRQAFPDLRGFSPRNLKYMRAFAGAWPERAIVQQAAAQIPWFHNGWSRQHAWVKATAEKFVATFKPRLGIE